MRDLRRAAGAEDPLASDPINDLLAPSGDHWFGTDKLGRDVFARVIAGARDILIVAPLATILGTVIGTALGLVTGYFRGVSTTSSAGSSRRSWRFR